jgi:flagellar biosynthesis/type III secretory pathway protein FliH
MTFVALVRDPSVSFATDQLILRAEEVQTLASAVDIGQRLVRLLAESEQQLALARQVAVDEGHVVGKEAGLLAARDEVAARLTAMALAAHHQRLALQGSMARLAIQVVRKLAGEIGAPEMVAGLAQTAAADLLPETSLTLRVHPSVVDAVSARMGAAHAGKSLHVEVRADDALDLFDCILDTAFGTTIAGLEDQLKCLETVLGGEERGEKAIETSLAAVETKPETNG